MPNEECQECGGYGRFRVGGNEGVAFFDNCEACQGTGKAPEPKRLFVLKSESLVSPESARAIQHLWEKTIRETEIDGAKLLILEGGFELVELTGDGLDKVEITADGEIKAVDNA